MKLRKVTILLLLAVMFSGCQNAQIESKLEEESETETSFKELQKNVARYDNYIKKEIDVAKEKSQETYYIGNASSYVQELAYYLSECSDLCTSELMTYEEATKLNESVNVDLYKEWFNYKINNDEIVFENRYEDCGIDNCSQEMLYERWKEVRNSKDNTYFGERVDIKQALIDLYGVNIDDLEAVESIQDNIESWGEMMEEGNPFAVQHYANAIMECGASCYFKYMTYEEAVDLIESNGYFDWWHDNGEKVIDPEKKAQKDLEVAESFNSSSSPSSLSSSNTNKDPLEQEAEEYFKQVSGVNLNRFEGIIPGYDDYEYVISKFCFNKKGTLQSETKSVGTTYQIYSWEDGEGGIVTISFIDGVVSTKSQVGLK